MAQTPRWNQPLSTWRSYHSGWIRKAEPQEVLEFAAFFDFRAVHGDRELAETLRVHVFDEAAAHPAFFAQLAQHVMAFKPPVQLFGRIIAGGSRGQDAQTLDLKSTAAAVIGFARLYALRERVAHTNTIERLSALGEAGVQTQTSRDETAAAFGNLMGLRLQGQAEAREAGEKPDNLVAWRSLGDVERTLVNQAFSQIVALQKRVSHDFLGDTS